MELRIGTSGWHYPGGRGTWDGIFYPRPEDRPRGFDELRFYAERFNTVEINSTFYGQPRATVSLGWAKRTPPGFEFSVKLFQKFTHPATARDQTPVGAADVDAFRGGIEPLVEIGYIFIPSFYDETLPQQIEDALNGFDELDGLILDLRLNFGGASNVAQPIMEFFADGTVGKWISRDETETLILEGNPIYNSQTVPLVVMVSEDTVSFGELFAGIMRDARDAKITGETSLGNVELLSGTISTTALNYGLPHGHMIPPSQMTTGRNWASSRIFNHIAVGIRSRSIPTHPLPRRWNCWGILARDRRGMCYGVDNWSYPLDFDCHATALQNLTRAESPA